jgi:hypothetical protein
MPLAVVRPRNTRHQLGAVWAFLESLAHRRYDHPRQLLDEQVHVADRRKIHLAVFSSIYSI